MARNVIVTTLWLGILCHSLIFLPTNAQTEADEEVTTIDPNLDSNDTFLPSTVAEIVQAISNVQRNVTETMSKVPNIKVAGGNKSGTNSSVEPPANVSSTAVDPQMELTLFEPDTDMPIADVNTKQENEDSSNDVSSTTAASDSTAAPVNSVDDTPAEDTEVDEDVQEETVTETPTDGNLTVPLNPPAVSIFSYDGASQWFNWAVSMRDPTINPEGTLGWPTIVTRGIQSIFQYYNPLRRFMARSLNTANTINSVASDIYNYRREVIEALLSNTINPDMQSINDYVKTLETNKKVAERISLLSEQQSKTGLDGVQEGLGLPTINNVTDAIDAALDQLFEPLDTVPDEWDRFAGVFGDPFSGVLRAPFYIKFINLGLKALYVLIILAYIPFSGIENFFLAPFPPNMDTYPGILRFWGLQAVLGPDYIEDYDLALEGLSGEIEGAASSAEEVVYDYDDDVRRLDGDESEEKRDKRKVPKKSNKKKPIYYNNLSDEIKPPPSRYGMHPKSESSYISYKTELKGSTSSNFAVIQDSRFVTSRPVSYGSTKSGSLPTHFAKVDDSPGVGAVPVVYPEVPRTPTGVRYMIMSNNAELKSSTQAPPLVITPYQSATSPPTVLVEDAIDSQQSVPSSQQHSVTNEATPASPSDYYSLIAGESISRPDFHVAEPIESPSVAAVRNPYGYSANTVSTGQGPAGLSYISKAEPVVSYTLWEIPSSLMKHTPTLTPAYTTKGDSGASVVLQSTVSTVPTSSFSAAAVSRVSTSTTPATITVTSVSSSVSTKYGK